MTPEGTVHVRRRTRKQRRAGLIPDLTSAVPLASLLAPIHAYRLAGTRPAVRRGVRKITLPAVIGIACAATDDHSHSDSMIASRQPHPVGSSYLETSRRALRMTGIACGTAATVDLVTQATGSVVTLPTKPATVEAVAQEISVCDDIANREFRHFRCCDSGHHRPRPGRRGCGRTHGRFEPSESGA